MKVLGITGSPRRGGNTDLLLQEATAGAASAGSEIKTVTLADLNIAPCRHCDGCLKTGKCVVEDDIQWIHTELRKADRLILASPIFFMGLTAQTKLMIDRCQALWVLKYILKLPISLNSGKERKGIFISVGAATSPDLFQPSLAIIRSFFKTLDITYSGELTFSGIDKKGAISEHPTALREAFQAGKSLAQS